jgi:hypothetical protein
LILALGESALVLRTDAKARAGQLRQQICPLRISLPKSEPLSIDIRCAGAIGEDMANRREGDHWFFYLLLGFQRSSRPARQRLRTLRFARIDA